MNKKHKKYKIVKRFKITDRRLNMNKSYIQGGGFQMLYNGPKNNDNVDNSGWENTDEDLKIVTECGRKPAGPISIIFSRVVKNKVDLLMKRFPNCEWLAYLIGDADSRYVKDIILPEQEASSGAVHVIGPKPVGTIGVIHSHHGMGAFFSGTDDAYINQNNDISVVVAHKGIKSMVKWVTPCGHKVEMDGKVVIESENLFDEVAFLTNVDNVVNTVSTIESIETEELKAEIKKNAPKTGGSTGTDFPIPKELGGTKHTFSKKYKTGAELLSTNIDESFEDDENLQEAIEESFGAIPKIVG